MTDLAGKKDHVRSRKKSGETKGHHCHYPGCEKLCAPAQWGCYSCWMKVPAFLRRKLWAAYRVGQEDSKTPSREYVAVAKEIQIWITCEQAGL